MHAVTTIVENLTLILVLLIRFVLHPEKLFDISCRSSRFHRSDPWFLDPGLNYTYLSCVTVMPGSDHYRGRINTSIKNVFSD